MSKTIITIEILGGLVQDVFGLPEDCELHVYDYDEGEKYYFDPDTQKRLKVRYRVHLTMPATHDGQVEIEAYTKEEAARLALPSA